MPRPRLRASLGKRVAGVAVCHPKYLAHDIGGHGRVVQVGTQRRSTPHLIEAMNDIVKAGKLVAVAGGGDTVAALHHAGCAEDFSFVSTAGGAFLEWMEGKTLPGVAALTNQNRR